MESTTNPDGAEETQQVGSPPTDRDIEAQVRRNCLHQMPEFSNRTTLALEDLLSNQEAPHGERIQEARRLVELLRDELQEEQRMTPKRQTTLDSIRNALELGNLDNIAGKVSELKRELMPLWVGLVSEYVSRAKTTAEQIKGKNVLLLLGNTGAGKSTTFHYLYGTALEELKRENIMYIGTKEVIVGPAAAVNISPLPKSETRYITAAQIDLKKAGIRTFKEDLYLCDSPGFLDTGGPEIDIANMIGIAFALRGCKTLRVVMLSSYLSIGDRWTSIKQNGHMLANLFSDIEENLGCLAFLFSKFPEDFIQNIRPILENLLDTLPPEDANDQVYVRLIETICDSFEDWQVVKPLEPKKRKPLLEKLIKMKPLKNVSSKVNFFLTKDSMQSIDRYISITQPLLDNALKLGRLDIVLYTLAEVRQLGECTGVERVKQLHTDVSERIQNYFKEFLSRNITNFTTHFNPRNEINEEACTEMSKALAQLAEADRVFQLASAEPLSLYQELFRVINEGANSVVDLAKSLELTDPSIHACFINLQRLSHIIPQAADSHSQLKETLREQVKTRLEECPKFLTNKQYNEFAIHYETLQKISSTLGQLLDIEIEARVAEFSAAFQNPLEQAATEIPVLLMENPLTDDHVTELNERFHTLDAAVEATGLPKSFIELAKTGRTVCIESANKVIASLRDTALQPAKGTQKSPMQVIFHKLEQLKKVTAIEDRCEMVKMQILDTSESQMKALRAEAEDCIRSISADGAINWQRLQDALKELDSLSWRDEFFPNSTKAIKDQIFYSFKQYIEALVSKAQRERLTLRSFNRIGVILELCTKIEQAKQLCAEIDGAAETCDEGLKKIIGKITKVTDEITEKYPDESMDGPVLRALDQESLEASEEFIDACLNYDGACDAADSARSAIENWLSKYASKVFEELKEKCDSICDQASYSHESKPTDMKQKASSFAKRFKEVNRLMQSHSKLLREVFTPPKFDEIAIDLDAGYPEIETALHRMRDEGHINQLRDRLPILHPLRTLEVEVAQRFGDLADSLKEFVFSAIGLNKTEVFQSLNALNSRKVVEIIRSKTLSEVMSSQVLYEIEDTVKQAIKQIQMRINKLKGLDSDDSIEEIAESLARLSTARREFSSVLLDEQKTEVEKTFDSAVGAIAKQINKCLDNAQDNINAGNICDASARIEKAEEALHQFESFMNGDTSEKIRKQIEKSKKDTMDNPADKIKQYETADLDQISLDPPKEKYEQIERTGKMQDVLFKFKTTLTNRFRAQLKAKAEDTAADQSEQLSVVDRFEKNIEFMPEAIHQYLKDLCQESKTNIEKNHKGIRTNAENAIKDQNFDAILEMVADARCEQRLNAAKQIEEMAQRHLAEQCNEVRRLLDEGKYAEGAEKLQSLAKHGGTCVQELSSLAVTLNEARANFQDHVSTSCRNLQEIQCQHSTPEVVYQSLERFESLAKVIDTPVPELEKSKEQFYDAAAKVAGFFEHVADKFRQALKHQQFGLLAPQMELMSKWDSVYTKACAIGSTFQAIEYLKRLSQVGLTRAQMNNEVKTLADSTTDKITQLSFSNLRQEQSRRAIVDTLVKSLLILKALSEAAWPTDTPDVTTNYGTAQESLNNKLNELASVQQVFDNPSPGPDECEEVGSATKFLKQLSTTLQLPGLKTGECLIGIEQRTRQFIETLATKAERMIESSGFSASLCNLHAVAIYLDTFKEDASRRTNELLKKFVSVHGYSKVLELQKTLMENDSGSSIVNEYQVFKNARTFIWKEKTQKHNIDYVLKNLRGAAPNIGELRNSYNNFHSQFTELSEELIANGRRFYDVQISNIKLNLKSIRRSTQSPSKLQNLGDLRHDLDEMLSTLFALWCYRQLEDNSTDLEERNADYLFQPHPAQVVGILRMLGVGYQEKARGRAINNFVEIGTGEGKSIVLGMTAMILALHGFDVFCVCYSSYLSQRDHRAFEDFFNECGVKEHIQYGTFNQICEAIINENGHIRTLVTDTIFGCLLQSQTQEGSQRPKVLLIDEVDVFFSEAFFGQFYRPAASLKHELIEALVHFVWEKHEEFNFAQIKESSQYAACREKFHEWTPLIDEAIKDMLSALRNLSSHTDYEVQNDKIGYRSLDSLSFNVSYGYATMFAYFREHQKGRISDGSLKQQICISLQAGEFLYSEIPKKFHWIIGVTGSLECLSGAEKDLIQNQYDINCETYLPSVYGPNNRIFGEERDVHIIPDQLDYYQDILNEIETKRTTNSVLRPVLLFFETETKLNEFYNWRPFYERYGGSAHIVTERTSEREKVNLFAKATRAGSITLFTKVFGRGIDFIYSEQVNSAGGSHVIQTFAYENESEQLQIMGRTARQGAVGSYSMIILQRELEKFRINEEDLAQWEADASVYQNIRNKRAMYFEAKYVELRLNNEKHQPIHEDSQNFYRALVEPNPEVVREKLLAMNKGAVIEGDPRRTLIALDATCSMHALLRKTKNTIARMIEEASRRLSEGGYDPNMISLQVVVYRNYNCREHSLLQHSSWETKAQNLRDFLAQTSSEGGWGNEAIECALWHANQEHQRSPLAQIIVIGDAPANAEDDISRKRERFGEQYWSGTKFAQKTHYQKELATLKTAGIPIQAFYVAERARGNFEELARETGGSSGLLDIYSEKGADLLTQKITSQLLSSIDPDLARRYNEENPLDS